MLTNVSYKAFNSHILSGWFGINNLPTEPRQDKRGVDDNV